MTTKHHKYPLFLSESRRDYYLDKLIADGHRVRAKEIFVEGIRKRFIVDFPDEVSGDEFFGTLYTVENIDK